MEWPPEQVKGINRRDTYTGYKTPSPSRQARQRAGWIPAALAVFLFAACSSSQSSDPIPVDDKAFAQRAYDKLLGSGKRKSSDPESMDASASGGAADGAPMVSGPPDSGDKETDSGLPVEIPGIVSPAPLLCKQVCERIINECGATGDTRDCTAYCESSVSETEALCVAGAASCKAMCGACFPCE